MNGLAYKGGVSESFPEAISARTRYCAVYGYPVGHSASPAMHNAGLAVLGLDWRYLAFEVRPGSLPAAIAGAKAMRFLGLNLTVPHKLPAVNLVDVLDPSAQSWGAVNTIRFEAKTGHEEWRPLAEISPEDCHEIRALGFNTDAEAITQAIREDLGMKLSAARVLLLGTGGAGRVTALKLAAEGVAELYLVNRTIAKAEGVAAEIRQHSPEVTVTVGYPPSNIDLVINATSLGLKPEDRLPWDEAQFSLRRASAVYDMIYRPAETQLLSRAKSVGCRTANGLHMLLYQGAKALELWTNQPAPLAVMREALARNVYGSAAP